MRTYVGDQEAVNEAEFKELANGSQGNWHEGFRELFLGLTGESADERAARRAVAREVLAELQEQSETDDIARLNALYAEQLSSVVLMRAKASTPRTPLVRAA
ncbi:hypothetical protein J7I98_14520 [Streptomyces sp. ISL-98]|uniref:hypothetical protein n=1 Tax=Streptomyces sp. ISL-98 TaxID=2819192 RepID=UPI001BE98A64|nr:hypothetical protein [Streptomyces sp. ISL-98]MBT2507080.1 hypothetical protein [Streptomyces sp. ISL-98]